MKILLCEKAEGKNHYIKNLANEYIKRGHSVIFGVNNFLYSSFLPDIVHIQWPEAIYKWSIKLPRNKNSLDLLKKRLEWYSKNNISIIYTVHNILPHENSDNFDKKFFNQILKNSNLVVHHGKSSIKKIKTEFPICRNSKHIIAPHGPYNYINYNSKKAKNLYKLPLDKYVYLNFGAQREYKGNSFSKKVFKKWNNKNVFFFTIGEKKYYSKNNNLYSKINRHLKKITNENVYKILNKFTKKEKTILKSINNKEIPKIMAASDVVFLGHQSGLNSGILALAASYKKPIVFPDIGNFKEQLIGYHDFETYSVSNINSAKNAIKRINNKIKYKGPGKININNEKWLKENSWEKHVKVILSNIK